MHSYGLRTRIAPLVLAAALVGGVAVTSTATAPKAHAAGGSYYLYFKKNSGNPLNSTLFLKKSVPNGKRTELFVHSEMKPVRHGEPLRLAEDAHRRVAHRAA